MKLTVEYESTDMLALIAADVEKRFGALGLVPIALPTYMSRETIHLKTREDEPEMEAPPDAPECAEPEIGEMSHEDEELQGKKEEADSEDIFANKPLSESGL